MHVMSFVKPFLAGSFGVAAALRGSFTLIVDLGAGAAVKGLGIAQLGMIGELTVCAAGGALFAVYVARHPFSKAKKN